VSSTIGDLVDRAARARGWGDQRVAFEIGVLPSEKVFNATQVKRLRRGERQHLSRELVERLIIVLDLPEDEAWHASGLWPPDLDLEGYRKFRALAADGMMSAPAGFARERRHPLRRRHLRLVEHVEQVAA
jgi:hypothetical protein